MGKEERRIDGGTNKYKFQGKGGNIHVYFYPLQERGKKTIMSGKEVKPQWVES